jgi:DNA-binding response OmpR family regulator
MKVLIIEDEENLAKILKMGLEKEGMAADYVLDGESGQRRIELHANDYDVVISDLMLPKKDGLDICREIREHNMSIPILVLTGRDTLHDKVTLLDAGADDFLVKPFQLAEVLARIRALSRRPKQVLPTQLSAGELRLSPATMEAFLGDSSLKLTLKEFRLLEYFMRHANQVCSRQDIVDNIWDFNFDSLSNVVDVYINRLRDKIETSQGLTILETVRGIGYRLKTS